MPALPSGGETILVVEDDVTVRKMAVGILEGLGYKVQQAADGKSALEILSANDHMDLLFTDMIMHNGLTGQDLVQASRKLRPDMKQLLTSGYSEQFLTRRDANQDVRLLGKPYRTEKLATAVRHPPPPEKALDGPAQCTTARPRNAGAAQPLEKCARANPPNTPSDITFCKDIALHTPPHEVGEPNLLVAERDIEHWGIIKSMEITVYRDGDATDDIATRTIGVTKRDGKLTLKFQMTDPTTNSVADHAYRVQATVHFLPNA